MPRQRHENSARRWYHFYFKQQKGDAFKHPPFTSTSKVFVTLLAYGDD